MSLDARYKELQRVMAEVDKKIPQVKSDDGMKRMTHIEGTMNDIKKLGDNLKLKSEEENLKSFEKLEARLNTIIEKLKLTGTEFRAPMEPPARERSGATRLEKPLEQIVTRARSGDAKPPLPVKPPREWAQHGPSHPSAKTSTSAELKESTKENKTQAKPR